MSTTVAFLGPRGTFTEMAMQAFAARGCFDADDVTGLPVCSPAEALDAVVQGRADYACVAIENSVDGAVTPTFDALAAAEGVQIYHEFALDISFAFMRGDATPTSTPPRLSTHPVAWQQVKLSAQRLLGEVEFIPASSNAAAAEAVARGEADYAAAPEAAAELWGLQVVASDVADVRGARTQFVVVGSAGVPTPRTGNDRTSVVFTLPNVPGSLVGALTEFSLRGVDLTRIESRPTRTGLGTYRFHADLVGHIDDAIVAEALRALHMRCESLHYLGSWPHNSAPPEQPSNTPERDAATAWVARMKEGQR
ncbi:MULTISPECIES: prephenate dehydratase [Corynebacterium]|uniref:prephenate dehydratase n=1 Tax=Corynebacterium TaxID=1716 RepID=UPI00124E47D4|nr:MULTISPECIES: prephenate dehydratase [Corynebacterium]